MIRIHHVLKDGTQVEAVEGHVVKMKDHPALYQMIKCMERKEKQGGKPGNRGFSGVENGQILLCKTISGNVAYSLLMGLLL